MIGLVIICSWSWCGALATSLEASRLAVEVQPRKT